MTAGRVSRRQFVGAAATALGASLASTIVVNATPQDPVIGALRAQGKSEGREKVTWKLEPFPMQQVRLLEGPFKQAMDINNKWLLSLPADRLLHSFRLTSGFTSAAEPLGGWEKPDCELRGHFAGGHVLSALALAYAS